MQTIENLTVRNAVRAELDACGEHALEQLLPAERIAYETARTQAGRLEDVSPAVVAVLLAAIQRLEHDATHDHWGGLECDQQELYPDPFRLPVIAQLAPPSAFCEPDDGPAFVYRYYDRCGCLLYVGVTGDFDQRDADHAGSSPWRKLVASFTVASEASRAGALAAEQRAIDTESPAFNHAGRSSKATAEQVTRYLLAHAGRTP